MKKAALFLDRDGIINVDHAYVYRFENIEWVEGIFDLIRFANDRGLFVFVLTNQSGVALGKYCEEDVVKLHRQMNDFLKEQKAIVHDWFYCPSYESDRRKPRPGMMIEAKDRYDVDLEKSFMVGDKISDILEIEGPRTLLLQGNYPLKLEGLASGRESRVEIFSSLKDIQKRIEHFLSVID
jgi:D,D-heptose 1,7-bisphosphate phosphatase